MIFPTMQTVSSKGQLIVPAAIRKALGIKSGTNVSVGVDFATRSIRVVSLEKDHISAAAGFLKKYDPDGKMFSRLLLQKREEIARDE